MKRAFICDICQVARTCEACLHRPWFDLVCSAENWKDPIDCKVQIETFHATAPIIDAMSTKISDAIEFFAGCRPTIRDCADRDGCRYLHIKAVGYYSAVGA